MKMLDNLGFKVVIIQCFVWVSMVLVVFVLLVVVILLMVFQYLSLCQSLFEDFCVEVKIFVEMFLVFLFFEDEKVVGELIFSLCFLFLVWQVCVFNYEQVLVVSYGVDVLVVMLVFLVGLLFFGELVNIRILVLFILIQYQWEIFGYLYVEKFLEQFYLCLGFYLLVLLIVIVGVLVILFIVVNCLCWVIFWVEEYLCIQVYIDVIMGLENCYFFNEQLSEVVEWGLCFEKLLVIVVLDFDNFKVVNDVFGYYVGDELLW